MRKQQSKLGIKVEEDLKELTSGINWLVELHEQYSPVGEW